MKKLLRGNVFAGSIMISLLLLVSAVSSYANSSDLLGYWSFDTIENDVVPDLSGNGFDGVLSDEPVPGLEDYEFDETKVVVNGACGKAVFFNGQTSKISVKGFPGVNENITVELWFKMRSPLYPYLIKQGDLPFSPMELKININSTLQAQLSIEASNIPIFSTSEILIDNWYHVAVTADGEQMKMYLNGNLESTVEISGNVSVGNGVLKFGFGNYPGSGVLDGWLDEVRIYDHALSQKEIQEDMDFCHPEEYDVTIHSLAGEILGNLQEGFAVALSGDQTATTFTDKLGKFSFSDLPAGDYIITPQNENCSFTPSLREVTLDSLNHNQIAFEASYTGNQNLGVKLWECYLGKYGIITGNAAVSEDKVFQGSIDGNLYCLNKENGEILWSYSVQSPEATFPLNALNARQSIFDENRIYVASGIFYDPVLKLNGKINCLDIKDGSLIWEKTIGNIDSWPAIYKGNIYVGTCSGTLYCLDKETGEEVWSYQFGEGSNNLMEGGQAIYRGKVYFSNLAGNVYCLDAKTGQELWVADLQTDTTISCPALSRGRLYIGGGFNRKVHCLDAETGKELWSYQAGGTMNCSPAVSKEKVYIGRIGYVYCLDAETGNEVWTFQTEGNINNKPTAGQWFSAPTVVNGNIYVSAWDNSLYCLSGETGEKLWSYNMGRRPWDPVFSQGNVFFGGNRRIFCINAGSEEVGEWPMYHKNLYRTGSTAVISGKVVSSNGKPLSNVKVEVEGVNKSFTDITDDRGYYEFADLTEGNYTLYASTEAYAKATEQISLNPLMPIDDLDFMLQPSICLATFALDFREKDLNILRRIRDEVLSKTPVGQEIIRLYYEWSPMIVMMEKDDEFKKQVKEMIDGILPLIMGK